MKKIILFIIVTFLVCTNASAEDVYLRALNAVRHIEDFTRPLKRHLKKNNIDLEFFGGMIAGYDNNVNLDPDRKKDMFIEGSLNTEATYNYTDDLRLKVENYTTNTWYLNENEANLIDVYNKINMESDLFDDAITFGTDYALENAIFPNDEDGTYLGSHARVYVRHNIFPYLYHEMGYRFLYKWYANDRTLHADGYRTENSRKDARHGMDYEAGMRILDRLILKTGLVWHHNNANYEYFKFYDFWYFSVRPSFLYKITDRFYASGNYTYRQRRYDGRLSTKNNEHVYDDTNSFTFSGLYDLTESFTLVVSYSYRENTSNEPVQDYSGSLVTGGVYYSF